MISTDHYIRIASGKKICQDHAVSGKKLDYDDFHYGIVADGCSTAPKSEIGAVALVESLEPYLYPACNFTHSFLVACGRADVMRELRRTSRDCLRATLLCVTSFSKEFRTAIGADGYEVYRRRGTSAFEIRHVEFTANAPPYPAYFISNDIQQYANMCLQKDNKRILSGIVIDLATGDFHQQLAISSWDRNEVCITSSMGVDKYDMALVFSDGLNSFVDQHDQPVPLEEVLKVFLPFKGLNGDFLQRRMNFAFTEVAKRGWRNVDDFSVAGISHESN